MKNFIILIILMLLAGGTFIVLNVLKDESPTLKNIFKETYENYKKGDKITFNNKEWYVLNDSDINTEYLTLISSDVIFLDDKELSKIVDVNYNNSKLNEYLNNEYIKEYGKNNFIEIKGYKVRLFNEDDLNNIVTEYDEEKDKYIIKECPDYICLNDSIFSTMIETKNKDNKLKYYNLSNMNGTMELQSIINNDNLYIRPIINIYKKSLDTNRLEELYE